MSIESIKAMGKAFSVEPGVHNTSLTGKDMKHLSGDDQRRAPLPIPCLDKYRASDHEYEIPNIRDYVPTKTYSKIEKYIVPGIDTRFNVADHKAEFLDAHPTPELCIVLGFYGFIR